ncbi:MAG: cysteine desulfurase family protein [Eubacteriaceae bacterium]
MREIYLDNAATTKIDSRVAEVIFKESLENYGNPSSLHRLGIQAEQSIKKVRERIANTLHCEPGEIYFTSGGTEGNNMIIQGILENKKREKSRIVTTEIEHASVLETIDFYKHHQFEVVHLAVDHQGRVCLDGLKKAVNKDTVLVSIVGVNNEIGTIQDLETIGKIIKKENPDCFYHTDFVQGYLKIPINVKKCQLDGLTLSGHKIFGPKGIGGVYIKKGTNFKAILRGGGQEKNGRSGTENVHGILGLGEAVALRKDEIQKNAIEIKELRDQFVKGILEKIEDVKVNGSSDGSPYILSMSFNRIRGEVLLHSLEAQGVYVSTGSACSTHKKEKQTVLKAIGLPEEYKEGTIRFSFSKENTLEEINEVVDIVAEAVRSLRLLSKKLPGNRK